MNCKHCGAQNAQDSRFCLSCGKELEQQAQTEYIDTAPVTPNQEEHTAQGQHTESTQQEYRQPAYTQPGYSAHPPEAPARADASLMGTSRYLGVLLLMLIPVVGFVFMCVWAFGGTKNLSKRNLARAMLIVVAICLVLSILVVAVLASVVTAIMQQWMYESGGNPGDFYDFFEYFGNSPYRNFGHTSKNLLLLM